MPGWDQRLHGTQKPGTCTASASKAQRNTLPYGGKCVPAVECLNQAKVSATEPHVTDDKRVMIYWEKCPVKSVLVILFIVSYPSNTLTLTKTPHNYKLEKGAEVILPHTV